jgi:chorismate dehydratase
MRIATVPYVNAAPLVWGFERGGEAASSEVIAEPPARIPGMLLAGRVDAGLVPVIEAPRLAGAARLLPLGVASRTRARSVFLASKRPLEEIRTVALDRSSRSSVALLRVLLAQRKVAGVSFSEQAPDLPTMLERADAALIIGDPALRSDVRGLRQYDLAEEWIAMTGLPFVFAAWAVRKDAPLPEGDAPFRRSLDEGKARIDAIARETAPGLGLSEASVADYLRTNIQYELGPEELRGLDLFLRHARDLGLIESTLPAPSLHAFDPRPRAAGVAP